MQVTSLPRSSSILSGQVTSFITAPLWFLSDRAAAVSKAVPGAAAATTSQSKRTLSLSESNSVTSPSIVSSMSFAFTAVQLISEPTSASASSQSIDLSSTPVSSSKASRTCFSSSSAETVSLPPTLQENSQPASRTDANSAAAISVRRFEFKGHPRDAWDFDSDERARAAPRL